MSIMEFSTFVTLSLLFFMITASESLFLMNWGTGIILLTFKNALIS